MHAYFLKLAAHEAWANGELFTVLQGLPAVPPRTRELCAHILSAHQFIEKRLRGQPVNFADWNFFPGFSLAECAALNAEYATRWPAFLRALPAPLAGQTVAVYTPDGTPRSVCVVDVLTHLHSHSVHHRGQIAVDMRAAGLEPLNTDFLQYCRTHG